MWDEREKLSKSDEIGLLHQVLRISFANLESKKTKKMIDDYLFLINFCVEASPKVCRYLNLFWLCLAVFLFPTESKNRLVVFLLFCWAEVLVFGIKIGGHFV